MKKVFKKGFTAAACVAAILAGSGLAHAETYTFSDLYLNAAATSPNYKWNPNQGKPENKAYSINDKGQVVGYLKGLYPTSSQTHLVRWDNVGSSSMAATDLGVPLSTGVMTAVGYGINYSGQIVGYTWGSSNFYHGLLYTPANPSTATPASSLDLNGYMNTTNNFRQTNALAINDAGKIVGIAGQTGTGNSAPTTAFYFDGSTMINIPGATLGSTTGSSSATSISNTGLVTGYSTESNVKKAYIWDSNNTAAPITLINNIANAVSSWGNDINDSGIAVGGYILSDGAKHAFLYQNSTMTEIGSLGGSGTEAMAINNNGVIVGTSNGHAFMYQNGVMTDLNNLIDSSLGFTLTSATGINNLGQIIGYGTVQAFNPLDGKFYMQERAFAMTPTPTPIPAALPLFLSGLGVLGVFRRRFFRR